MAFLIIKATSLLLITTLVFTSYGVVEANPLVTLIKGLFTSVAKITAKESGKNADTMFGKAPGKNFSPGKNLHPPVDKRPAKGPGQNSHSPIAKVPPTKPVVSVDELALRRGEALAEKYFGTGGKNSFRIGWKGTKYYLKAAEKCEEYHNTLNPNCNSQRFVKLRPVCVAKYCIVVAEVLNITVDASCNYHDDCDFPIDQSTVQWNFH